MAKCQDGSFRPVTQHDIELAAKWKPGQGIKIKAVQQSDRSIRHHRLYFGGLLALAMDYWEPKGGLIAPAEKSTLLSFADWLDRKGGDSGAIRRACRAFLTELAQSRASKIEAPQKDVEALHEWVKIEAGYFRYVMTPSGIRKEPLSINFNAMDQDKFAAFYKAAFSVVWRFILSRTFKSEAEAQQCIDQLVAMG